MPELSAVVIAFNEEKHIERCIRSLQSVADEVVVLDSYSTDRTPEICRALGVRFFQQKFLGYVEQKNHAVGLATHDIILSLDGDEALSEELAESIRRVKSKQAFDGYRFNRLNNFCGQWMRHTNYYPDRKLRLFDRRKGKWGGINPHDGVIMDPDARIARLEGHLLHWMCDSLEEHLDTINRFSSIAAREAFNNGRTCSAWKVWYKPLWRFFHYFVVKRGFLDGYMGLVVSRQSAYLCFQKYAKLRQMQLKARGSRAGKELPVESGLQGDRKMGLKENNDFLKMLGRKKHSAPGNKVPSVAVIITTFNQVEWLEKALWGYMVQTHSAFELVVADDGSGEETRELLRHYREEKGMPIRHVWQEDKGFRKCRILNRAIRETSAEYLIFSDGDCIPRKDFVESHVKKARPGCFQSGGYLKLNPRVSAAINQNDVLNQHPFSVRWLLRKGGRFSYKLVKLVRSPLITCVLNKLTPTRPSWNGHNVSGWRSDILKVNGFNEDMGYGGLDRELGERLLNAGIKGRQIRYYAISVHLHHARPYRKKTVLSRNVAIRKQVRKNKVAWVKNGIRKEGEQELG